jgi:hypothetical protein
MEINIKNIIHGHFNEITNREEKLYNDRMLICKKCPILEDSAFGPICSSKKYLDLKTNKIYRIPAEGRVTGCGCRLNAKARLTSSHCPLNKW